MNVGAASAFWISAGGQKEALLANSSDGNRRTSVNDDFDVRHLSSASLAFARRAQKDTEIIAYGRYWGALERVDCLHFEACYYQPLQWCIEHGVHRFEGGAQGEHKMARALLPVQTSSAHWLAHPAFADAVERFLEREGEGVDAYLQSLHERAPFRKTQNPP